jgi:C-terminal processing protease CtpA/Prc
MLDYVTIKGHRLEGNGLVPDVLAPPVRFGQPDKAIAEATNLLKMKPGSSKTGGSKDDGSNESAA